MPCNFCHTARVEIRNCFGISTCKRCATRRQSRWKRCCRKRTMRRTRQREFLFLISFRSFVSVFGFFLFFAPTFCFCRCVARLTHVFRRCSVMEMTDALIQQSLSVAQQRTPKSVDKNTPTMNAQLTGTSPGFGVASSDSVSTNASSAPAADAALMPKSE